MGSTTQVRPRSGSAGGPVGALLADDPVGGEALAQGLVDGALGVEVDVGDHRAGQRRGGLALLDGAGLAAGRLLAEAGGEGGDELQRRGRLLDLLGGSGRAG
ncbi:MAG: hypothetical protein PGN11_13600 [Quadrisphaera sp.]